MAWGRRKREVDAPAKPEPVAIPQSAVSAAEYKAIVAEGLSDQMRAEIRQQLEGRARLA